MANVIIQIRKARIMGSLPLPIFAFFASNGHWYIKPHLVSIAKAIDELINTSKQLLIVNMPPRHGKSELISKYFPAYYLLHNPSKRVILTTYSDRFSEQFGRVAQDLYTYNMKYFNCGLYQRKQSANEWLTDSYGGMVSVGAGGSLTGRGADMIIIDDPIKNVTEAMSDTHKENLIDWVYSTVFTRLEPGGKVILIMTRWQMDDLTGEILSKYTSDKYIHLKFKAIDDNNKPLWKERYNLKDLLEIRKKITHYWFNAMYQQEPTMKGSEYININNFHYYVDTGTDLVCNEFNLSVRKQFTRKLATVDLAITITEQSDSTVVLIFYIDNNSNVFIERVIKDKMRSENHEKFLIKIFHDYNLSGMGIEDVAYQGTIIQILSSRGVPVYSLKPHGNDKLTRLLAMRTFLNNGKVFLKFGEEWIKDFLNELQQFPRTNHDDQVDAFAYIAHFITINSQVQLTSARSKRGEGF
jgi:predicted phage terminase large subunit-like protein